MGHTRACFHLSMYIPVARDRLKICVSDCAIISDEISDILSKPVVLPMTLGNWSHDVFWLTIIKNLSFHLEVFYKRLNRYSIPLFQGKSGSADVVQILFDHGLEFQRMDYYSNALGESKRRCNGRLTKILRKMKINPVPTSIVCVIYNI